MPAFRVVLDTNVVLASKLTANPTSPNREVLDRWEGGEYKLLYSDDALLEYGEKLCEHGFSDEEVRAFLELVQALGEPVSIEFFHLPRFFCGVAQTRRMRTTLRLCYAPSTVLQRTWSVTTLTYLPSRTSTHSSHAIR